MNTNNNLRVVVSTESKQISDIIFHGGDGWQLVKKEEEALGKVKLIFKKFNEQLEKNALDK